ncbi:hypothetical protein BJA5080_04018 [Bradyrhizobium diazoefficiens SEMIA 5080]|uniref:Uncharacterized protein n=2 Tax=Bradyrhizobium diazoefficiens TaxID=1355477 RepID=A0A837CML0_9BRAD|nr:hypothetical protein BJA5080_04018 [Bradyrhizobium diazoefficiens SEMIA 5080]
MSNGAACSEARQSRETTPSKGVRFSKTGGSGMFEINGFDTAGVVSLKRLSLEAALKKARELVADGCWDVQIVDPTGRIYTSFEEQAA